MGEFKPLEWREGRLVVLDQTGLPSKEVYLEIDTTARLLEAIKTLRIRGAPAIGVAAAYGVVLAAKEAFVAGRDRKEMKEAIERKARELVSARPTAVNLKKAVERMMERVRSKNWAGEDLLIELENEARDFFEENLQSDLKIARYGSELISDGDSILTHCNTGALATAGYGTALGVIKKAFEEGKKIKVFVDETRPLFQGSRLTAWELERFGIDYEIIVDGAAGFMMARGEIDKVIVGADRIVLNGDTANKIGTYSLAVLARHHRIPFYVAAPLTTFDFKIKKGEDIPIEERSEAEVTELAAVRLAPAGARARNSAFDVTPSSLILAFITEKGVIFPPFQKNISRLHKGA